MLHAGLLLNNQMDDFSTPGQPNVYGIAPSKANFIRCGRRRRQAAAERGRLVPAWRGVRAKLAGAAHSIHL